MSVAPPEARLEAVEGHSNLTSITNTAWPESLPSKNEERILSICCGNTSLKWAIHQGAAGDFLPILFWSTPSPTKDEIDGGDPCTMLERHLPPGGHEVIFGNKGAAADKAQAARAAAERRVPTLSVYVVSTNPDNEAGVESMFKDIPCRMYRLQASDFFSVDDGAYEGIGIDRLSNLRASTKFYNTPVMVIDGGTALTYTAINAKGTILGGGICPGLAATLRSLHDYTGALPLLQQQEVEQLVANAAKDQTPLPIFSRTTETAIVATALKGMADICWGALKEFKRQLEADAGAPASSHGDNDPPTNLDLETTNGKNKKITICLTGGDAEMISKLLHPERSHIVQSDLDGDAIMENVEINRHRNLCHYGIGVVLEAKHNASVEVQSEDDKVRVEIIGQRVAKEFYLKNKKEVYRGTVAAAAAGENLEDDWFYIRYDDGDTEHLTITGLYDALKLFSEIGEEDPKTADAEKTKKKLAEAKDMADVLIDKSPAVKKHHDTPVEQRTASTSRKRGPTGSTKNTPMPANKIAKTKSFSKKQDPHSYVNLRVAKMFGPELYFGTITKFIAPPTSQDDELWHVRYDDDDNEDYDAKDLKKALNLYKANINKDKKNRVAKNSVEAASAPDAPDAMDADARLEMD